MSQPRKGTKSTKGVLVHFVPFVLFVALLGVHPTFDLQLEETTHDSSALGGRSAAPDLRNLAGFFACSTDSGAHTRPKRSNSENQRRGHESLAGYANPELPERRHWATPDCFARHEARE